VLARTDKTEAEFLGALNLIAISVHETVADPALLAAVVRALLTAADAPQWKTDAPLAAIVKTLEELRVRVRHAGHLRPVFADLQKAALELLHLLAVGPVRPSRALLAHFWADLPDPAHGRKAAAIAGVARLLAARTPR
jgi:hypothetical protein